MTIKDSQSVRSVVLPGTLISMSEARELLVELRPDLDALAVTMLLDRWRVNRLNALDALIAMAREGDEET